MKVITVLLLGMLCVVGVAHADPRMWGEQGIPIRKGTFPKWNRTVAQDVDGNTLVVWSDMRTPSRDIRAQLFNAAGEEQWAAGGVNVSPEDHVQDAPVAVAVNGGWIVAWVDYRHPSWPNPDIYAQKLDDFGNLVWTDNGGTGVAVDVAERWIEKFSLRIVHDGAGGAIMAWVDYRNYAPIYAQHVGPSGAVLWPSPLIISDVETYVYRFDADSATDGSMVVAWEMYGDATGYDVYAAKISPDGTLPWGPDGVSVCADSSFQQDPNVIADGVGGSYVVWRDQRNGNHDIYSQRLQSDGQRLWPPDGVPVCTDPSWQYYAQVALDISNDVPQGMLVVWQDPRLNGYPYQVWAQKISSEGIAAWSANGILVSADQQDYGCYTPAVASDHAGGLICAWEFQNEQGWPYLSKIYAACLSPDGSHLWTPGGQSVVNSGDDQTRPALCGNASAAFVAFMDYDSIDTRSVRAQMLNSSDGTRLLGDSGNSVISGPAGMAYDQCMFAMNNHRSAVIWQETHGRSGTMLYYQILGPNGNAERAINGEPLVTRPGPYGSFEQRDPQVCSDGVGGFFVSFVDGGMGIYLIRLSHVDQTGEVASSDSGEIVWSDPSMRDQMQAQLAPDGQGGCYVAWTGYDQQYYLGLWVMRMNAQLQAMWEAPVLLYHTANDIPAQSVVLTYNGCLVVWPSGEWGAQTISAARVSSSGTVVWTSLVCNVPQEYAAAVAVSDGLGGMYVAWRDYRSQATASDIYVQRVASNGQGHWGQNGIAVCAAAGPQANPQLITDGAGNLEVAWDDYRDNEHNHLYAQRITPAGEMLWAENGIPIARAGSMGSKAIVPAVQGGLSALWTDDRLSSYNSRAFATHLDSTGSVHDDPYWLPDSGGAIADLVQGDQSSVTGVADGFGGCVATWTQWKQDYDGEEEGEVYVDIFAQRIYDVASAAEDQPPTPRAYALYQNYPNPFNPATEIVFELPKSGHAKLTVFDLLGREVKTLVNSTLPSGKHSVNFDAGALPSGVYIYRLHAGSFQQSRKLVLLR